MVGEGGECVRSSGTPPKVDTGSHSEFSMLYKPGMGTQAVAMYPAGGFRAKFMKS